MLFCLLIWNNISHKHSFLGFFGILEDSKFPCAEKLCYTNHVVQVGRELRYILVFDFNYVFTYFISFLFCLLVCFSYSSFSLFSFLFSLFSFFNFSISFCSFLSFVHFFHLIYIFKTKPSLSQLAED